HQRLVAPSLWLLHETFRLFGAHAEPLRRAVDGVRRGRIASPALLHYLLLVFMSHNSLKYGFLFSWL
ncbi:MAG: hypothetical protein DMG36_20490, partial [Acidobacteria bacterium]